MNYAKQKFCQRFRIYCTESPVYCFLAAIATSLRFVVKALSQADSDALSIHFLNNIDSCMYDNMIGNSAVGFNQPSWLTATISGLARQINRSIFESKGTYEGTEPELNCQTLSAVRHHARDDKYFVKHAYRAEIKSR